MIDASGKSLARSRKIREDAIDIPVEWEQPIEIPKEPVQLRIALENARLFSLWCAE